MTFPVVVPPDHPIEVGDGGGQVWPLAFVDEQSADGFEPLTVNGRSFDPADEFDRIFIHGVRR